MVMLQSRTPQTAFLCLQKHPLISQTVLEPLSSNYGTREKYLGVRFLTTTPLSHFDEHTKPMVNDDEV